MKNYSVSRLVCLTFVCSCLLALSACHSMRQRIAWSKTALAANQSKENFPSPEEIDSFFDYEIAKQHPYLDPQFQKKLDQETNSELSAHNQLEILPNSHSLQKKLELIQNAKSSVYVTTFHIICDEGGKKFSQALHKAAQRGIDVRFLTTGGPWEWWYAGDCPTEMTKMKVKVAQTPYSIISQKGVVNLHDKILLVDGQQAVVGGQNIGSWFFETNGQDRKFRDTDVYVQGPVVNAIASRFVQLWKSANPKDNSLTAFEATVALQNDNAQKNQWRGEENYQQWLQTTQPKGLCRFVSQNPEEGSYNVFTAYQLYASHAQHRIAFHTPQLNTTTDHYQKDLWRALANVADKQDGRVFMLTNGPGFIASDMTPPSIGTIVGYYLLGHLYDSTLEKNDVEIFAYRSWIHSKVYYFDGLAVGIGSFNLDESGTDWTENTLICIDPDLVKQTTAMLKRDFAYSARLEKPSQEIATASKRKNEAPHQRFDIADGSSPAETKHPLQ